MEQFCAHIAFDIFFHFFWNVFVHVLQSRRLGFSYGSHVSLKCNNTEHVMILGLGLVDGGTAMSVIA